MRDKEKAKARSAAYRQKNRAALRERSAAYYKANREAIRVKSADSYKANREAKIAFAATYRQTHKEEIKARGKFRRANLSDAAKAKREAYMREHMKANREAYKAKQAARYKANRKKILAAKVAQRATLAHKQRMAAYRAANKERIKKTQKAYAATEAGQAARRRAQARRRARERGSAIGDPKLIASWEVTWRTAKSVLCHWCRKKFPGKTCHPDHRVPLSKGGAHDVENLVISCARCNFSKHDKMPDVFNAELEQPLLFY